MRSVGQRIRGACPAPLVLLAVVVTLALAGGSAEAANTRVSIANFAWSDDPSIDLGESVTWDWIGPDTAHSVTGTGPGGVPVDSSPGSPFPEHLPGDTFTVAFDQPGQFTFVCKIHSIVRGTVTVSSQPGDPDSDPGPQPPILFDRTPPDVREVGLARTRLGPKGRGTSLRFASSERGTAEVDYFRIVGRGPWAGLRFAGSGRSSAWVGYNSVPFARRGADFRASPGRYLARFRVADSRDNLTPAFDLRFSILRPTGGR